jgi:hypothetical protein
MPESALREPCPYPAIFPHADPVERWEELWRQGPVPDLHQFLAQTGPLPPDVALALLQIDQRQRWQREERRLVEAYLPVPIPLTPEQVLDLLMREVFLREEKGECGSLHGRPGARSSAPMAVSSS